MGDANYNYFIKTDLVNYIGEWIAIVDEKVVASGKSVKQVFAAAKQKFPKKKMLLAKVPSKETMIFYVN